MKYKQDRQLINNPLFQKELGDLEADYLHIRKAFNCYKNLLSRGNYEINHIFDSATLLMKAILATEKAYALFQKYTVMNFALLKMKACMLLGFIYLEMDDRVAFEKVMSPVLMALTKETNKFDFKHDFMFQFEVDKLLDALLVYGENVHLKPTPKLHIKLNVHELSNLLAKKCDSNFYKLKWLYETLKTKILRSGKHDQTNNVLYQKYMDTFADSEKKFNVSLDNKAITWETIIDHFNANIITFQFKIRTQVTMRHSSISAAIDASDLDYINKYIKLHNELLHTHILPVLSQFQKQFDFNNLPNSPLILGQFTWTYSEFFQLFIDQFYILIELNNILENEYKNPNKALLEGQILSLYNATVSLLTYYNDSSNSNPLLYIQLNSNVFHNTDEPPHPGYDLELMKAECIKFLETEEINKHIYDTEQALQEQIAKKNADLLILQEQRERAMRRKKRRPASIAVTSQPSEIQESQSESQEEEYDDLPVDLIQEHMDNGLLKLKKKKYSDAIDYFLKAKNAANWQKEHYQELNAIDALTVAYSYILQQDLDKILTTLNKRLRTTRPLSDDMKDELERLGYVVEERYNELCVLYQDFLQAMEYQTIASKAHQMIQELSDGKETIYSLICSIKRKIEMTEQKNAELERKKNNERSLYHTKLGEELITLAGDPANYIPKELIAIGRIKMAQHHKNENDGGEENQLSLLQIGRALIQTPGKIADYTPEEINALGKVKFSQLGRLKENNNSEKSIYTREKQLVDQLQIVFKDLSQHASSTLVDDLDKTPVAQIPVHLTESVKALFISLHQVSYEHYLVDSSAINILLAQWNQAPIKTCDFDFVTTGVDIRGLLRLNFKQSIVKTDLYCGSLLEQKVDLLNLNPESNWLMKSLLSRHFTIGALAVAYDAATDQGVIVDPTGSGFEDLQKRCIKIIGNPLFRLQHDPTIALAVIKYELLGFNIDPSVSNAMLQLTIIKQLPQAHLNALLTKLLQHFNEFEVLKLLIQYKLLNTLFNTNQECDESQTLFELKKNISLTSPGLFINPNRFFSNQTSTSTTTPTEPEADNLSFT